MIGEVSQQLAQVLVPLQQATVQVRSLRHLRGGIGAGVIWNSDGLVVTNAHVARGDGLEVELADGTQVAAVLLACDPERDLAALQLKATGLSPARPASSPALRPGQLLAAIGHPHGQLGSVSFGVFHSYDPQRHWLRADIRLAPGNSGGPLADAAGRVVGINTMVAGGLGFAIPAAAVEDFLTRHPPSTRRLYLGLLVQPVLIAEGQLALLVLDVEGAGPASAAGLLLGDLLLEANDQPFRHPDDLNRLLVGQSVGQPLRLSVQRGRSTFATTVVPVERDRSEAA